MKYIFVLLLLTGLARSSDTITYYGDGIRNVARPWTSEFQGMCHDENNYYAVARYHLWRIPKTVAMERVKRESESSGAFKVGIPDYLRNQGAHHMGDCDAHGGLVLVPLEGAWPVKILVFEANTLKLLGAPDLPTEQTDAAWVTIDHLDGSLVTGTFNIGPGKALWRHRLSPDRKSLETIGRINLWDAEGKEIDLKRVQGVEVIRSKNLIWLVSDTRQGGLYGFDLNTGRLVYRRTIKYKPGFPYYEELEGIDALEDDETPLPHYRGNLFVTMLNSNLFRDRGYLKLFEY